MNGNVSATKKHIVPDLILGINDSLIELTGALVGLSFALPDHKLVALSGLILGIAASLSMGASAYMHNRYEVGKRALVAGLYTGASYAGVVFLLIFPFLIFDRVGLALGLMFAIALGIIVLTTRYSSRTYHRSFFKEFRIMFLFSLGVATVSFCIGQVLRSWLLPPR